MIFPQALGRVHHFTDPFGDNSIILDDKKWNIGPEAEGHGTELRAGKFIVEQTVQSPQNRSGIAAPTAKPGCHRDPLVDPDVDTIPFPPPTGRKKFFGRPPGKIGSVRRQRWIAADQPQKTIIPEVQFHRVAEVELLHPGLKIVISIRPPAEDMKEEVDLGRGEKLHGPMEIDIRHRESGSSSRHRHSSAVN